MLSTPPKFVCTSTPTVHPPRLAGRRRELVPIPPFQPNAIVPAPAPTEPSATEPESADSSAWTTSPAEIGRDRMSFNAPSLVSPTTGLIDRTADIPGCASIQAII